MAYQINAASVTLLCSFPDSSKPCPRYSVDIEQRRASIVHSALIRPRNTYTETKPSASSEWPSQRSTPVRKTVRRVNNVSGFYTPVMEQLRMRGWCHMSVLAKVRWLFVVSWKKARGRTWMCAVNGSGCIRGCRLIDRLVL